MDMLFIKKSCDALQELQFLIYKLLGKQKVDCIDIFTPA